MCRTLEEIYGNPNDFKICENCNVVNWYENEFCWNCSGEDLKYDSKLIERWCEEIYDTMEDTMNKNKLSFRVR